MKHIKYPFLQKIEKTAYKKRISLLSKQDKKHYKTKTILSYFNVFFMFGLMAALIYLCYYVSGVDTLSKTLNTVIIVFLSLSIFTVPIAVCVLIFSLINKLLPNIAMPELNKSVCRQCSMPLKKYYHVGNDFIVTKCYKSTIDLLTNKDVLIFVYNNELRIVNDFSSTIKDFGCYCFDKNEIACYYEEINGRQAAVVKCKETKLLLGKRAKPFITKNLLSNEERKSLPNEN